MSKIVRHRMYEIHGENGVQSVRLKKWSASKLFYLIREFWSLLEKALSEINLSELDELGLVKSIIEVLINSEKEASQVIKASVDSPDDLTEANILEWDADCFIGVLTEVVEMNLTEELVKNFQKLLASFTDRAEKTRGEKKSTPTPEITEKKQKQQKQQPVESGV